MGTSELPSLAWLGGRGHRSAARAASKCVHLSPFGPQGLCLRPAQKDPTIASAMRSALAEIVKAGWKPMDDGMAEASVTYRPG